MALILKLVAAVSLATAALWTSSTLPVASVPAAPTATALWPGARSWARSVEDTLSLDAKLGQLVAARVTHATESQTRRLTAEGRIGSVVFPEAEVARHLDRLDEWQSAAPIPVLVAGQPVAADAAPTLPAPLALGAAGQSELAYLAGRALASGARPLGVHTPRSPLVVAPGGSPFGDASSDRSALGVALIRGLRDGGVMPSARLDGPAEASDFRAFVRAGLMETRLRVSASDSLPRVLDQIGAIRSDFNGLLVAEVDRAALNAAPALVEAGVDQIETDAPEALARALADGVRTGRLGPARIDQSVQRVLAAKAWNGLDALHPSTGRDAETAGGVQPLRFSPWRPPPTDLLHRSRLLDREIARHAVTVLQDEEGPVPLVGPRAPHSVLTILLDPSLDIDHSLPFANAVSTGVDEGTEATYVRLGLGESAERYADALRRARQADVVVVGAYPSDGALAARHRSMLETLLRSDRPIVVAAFDTPRLMAGLPRPAALVAAYDAHRASQEAAAEAIVGQIAVTGRLPVPVVGLYRAGAGARLRQQAIRPGTPEEAGLDPGAIGRARRVLEQAVESGAFPGAGVAIGRGGVLIELDGVGRLTRGGAPATAATAYDLASLTKVVATTTAVMMLVEQGRLDLDDRVVEYIPAYGAMNKGAVTIRHLLTHSAGHRPFYPFYRDGILDREGVLEFVFADTLQYRPGARSRYSDFDMILLGEIIERITGEDLGDYVHETIYEPLGMAHTGFRHAGDVDRTAAPTEYDRAWRGRTLQGEVHDEAAWVMGGVAGHAGLFSTAHDLSRFAFLLASGGEAYGTRLFRRTTLDRFTERVRLQSTYPTGLGWMVKDPGESYSPAGSLFGPRSFGHTGFTGTSIWVDPEQELFVVLLSNRVNPTRRNSGIREVRADLADAVAGAIRTPPGLAVRGLGFGPIPDDLPRVAAARNPASAAG